MLSPDNREIAYHRIAGDGPTKGSLNVFVRPLDDGAQLVFERNTFRGSLWTTEVPR